MITHFYYSTDIVPVTTVKREVKETVESKIGSFAFRIDSISASQKVVDYAEKQGLTVSNRLGKAGYTDYITFGVSKSNDVSFVSYRSDLPKGVKIIDVDDAKKEVRKMADKKIDLTVEDLLRMGDKTYRELATGKVERRPSVKKEEKVRTQKSSDCDLCGVVSDHWIIVNGRLVGTKKPNDNVNITIYSL